jgi:hypothetical protein
MIRVHPRGADVRFLAPTEARCRSFACFVVQVLNDAGVVGNLRRLHVSRKQHCLSYCVTSPFCIDALLEKFRLRRTNVGLRLGTPAPSVIAR